VPISIPVTVAIASTAFPNTNLSPRRRKKVISQPAAADIFGCVNNPNVSLLTHNLSPQISGFPPQRTTHCRVSLDSIPTNLIPALLAAKIPVQIPRPLRCSLIAIEGVRLANLAEAWLSRGLFGAQTDGSLWSPDMSCIQPSLGKPEMCSSVTKMSSRRSLEEPKATLVIGVRNVG
jgi:hypothetical protein